ncbi:MAG: peptidase S41, partial [Bacteroidota bacterium]
VVYDGAGINPDIKTEALAFNPLVETLGAGNYIFNYATAYCIKNKSIDPAGKFKLREDEYLEFVNFVESKKIEYTTKTETVFNDLKNKAERDGYYSDIKSEYEALKNKILSRKKDDLKLNKDAIIPWLEEEIAGRYYYQRGRMESTIKYDKEIKEALSIINDQKTRTEILTKIEKPNKPFNPKKKF